MQSLRSTRLIQAKAILFVVAGLLAATLLLLESPSLRIVFLLAITVWWFCRAYYFAFYVLQHYVDPSFRYAGLVDLARHGIARRMNRVS